MSAGGNVISIDAHRDRRRAGESPLRRLAREFREDAQRIRAEVYAACPELRPK